jgi:hypothetical protein
LAYGKRRCRKPTQHAVVLISTVTGTVTMIVIWVFPGSNWLAGVGIESCMHMQSQPTAQNRYQQRIAKDKHGTQIASWSVIPVLLQCVDVRLIGTRPPMFCRGHMYIWSRVLPPVDFTQGRGGHYQDMYCT